MVEGQKLDCIFDDEPVGFEKDPSLETKDPHSRSFGRD